MIDKRSLYQYGDTSNLGSLEMAADGSQVGGQPGSYTGSLASETSKGEEERRRGADDSWLILTPVFVSSSDTDLGDERKLPEAIARDHVSNFYREDAGTEELPVKKQLQQCFFNSWQCTFCSEWTKSRPGGTQVCACWGWLGSMKAPDWGTWSLRLVG